eukprot:CAMPEP_0174242030 /NCGR_PEP_ID=MMETSP0417-20130205/25965_1 /TAXON_ID=242541 /ORGANISM="Mayorella sp, Strain BSH-02190019" /LENGTH=56 /DNA_ID=CAMNT_0015321373 /DNA_START=61 /DNA_END=228 /DNA_ORIENTATION=+
METLLIGETTHATERATKQFATNATDDALVGRLVGAPNPREVILNTVLPDSADLES